MIKQNEPILLLSKEKSFIVRKEQKVLHTQYGDVDVKKIKEFGQKIKSSSGHEFVAVKPSITDLLRKCRRMPQIIMPKDAAQIVAVTGASSGWHCLDAGGGSGFLSLFLASIVAPGKITTYEKNKVFAKNIEHNVKLCNMEKAVTVKHKDILKGFAEKSLDLITLDMKDAEKLVSKAKKALNPGGWLVIYSPHIEQQQRARKELAENGFIQVHTIETMQRSWHVDPRGFTHPKPSGILHTGFMTFGRRV